MINRNQITTNSHPLLRTLQAEYHLANKFPLLEGPQDSFRVDTASPYHPPPYMCIDFELMVVDETQKLESASTTRDSQALSMARRLCARHKVSVSGTPLGNNRLSDLSSLCQVMNVLS